MTKEWMDTGTQLFLDTLAGVRDEELNAPCALPGWTGRHLIAHVHYNALALCRLTSWAATGVEDRMYDSPKQRLAEIDYGAALPITTLRDEVYRSSRLLSRAIDALPPDAQDAQVVTAQGRTLAASEIPWLRTREVFVHAVDLGASFESLPPEVTTALLIDVIHKRVGAGEGPGLAGWLTGRLASPPTLGVWL